jgi:protein gp37
MTEWTREDAEEWTQSLEQVSAGAWRQIALAQRLGVPKALGLTTEQWVKDRIGGYVKMSIPARREAVAELAAEGQSNREIAKVLGVDETTVRRDLPENAANAAAAEEKPSKSKGGRGGDAGNAAPEKPPVMLALKTHLGATVPYKQPSAKATFNRTNEQVSWSAWTWNPVTGCLHGCRYCYARELALKASYKDAYPIGFDPLFHHERLDAPAKTKVPDEAQSDARLKRVFVCSMADLYGKWVPDEWIERVHASCIANPQWDYLMLTKFPRRYIGMALPATAWLGTTVDEQKRVRLAEEAFREIKNVRVKWLSLEPLLAPLEFSDLSMFDWVVIGSQSATDQPDGKVDAFAPPFEWVARLVAQAREARCRVYLKPNLLGETSPQSAGMTLPQEEPIVADVCEEAAA